MSKDVSIAEARNNLPRLVHEAEEGTAIRFLRRGRPVAVVISFQEYERLRARRRGFFPSLMAFRRTHNLKRLDIEGVLEGVRDRDPGRDFAW